ncbi:hypothetical protein [Aeromonas sp. MrichA-1]|uniref:hypothetical protein n=1 Tax=Aeromonas sp. MrichA-1 TaxID=2823362 RepID=UPI001B33AE4E|nr:hypothetical protein [Aeromonas sp. MrichA-1]MBP4081945.1 hypothetical protein [Aeromonas sp. MrichA-1]
MILFMAPVLLALFWKNYSAFCLFLIFFLIFFSGGKDRKTTQEHPVNSKEVKNKE